MALFAENHAEGAAADLACLFHDILDTPINPHFNLENVVGICDALAINLVLANDRERIELLRRPGAGRPGPSASWSPIRPCGTATRGPSF
ncbi:MAG: hypothetical protein MZW92_03515 [Comamonadaceae bacterium]|nr:hypothetical protein [Comamonadaceae bacterium]